MADIFISYAREDRAFTQLLASRLEEHGWSVWWDRRIPTGKRFEKVIEEELHKAGCVIAVWSRHGVASDYVREEAADGRDRSILLPVFAEAVDAPFGFRGIQAADLRGWRGDPAHPPFLDFIDDMHGKIGPSPPRTEAATTAGTDDRVAPPKPKRRDESKPSLATSHRLGMAGLTLLIAAGAVGWWWSEGRVPSAVPREPTATAGPPGELRQPPLVMAAPEAMPVQRPSTTPVPRPEATRQQPDAEAKASSAQKKLAPRDVFRDCDVCPEMVVIPAGHFLMGSPDSDKERSSDEGPQHPVTIPDPFAIAKYEITFEQWDACTQDGGCGGYHPDDAGWGRGRRPVINVSWRDAKAYAEWLSRKTSKAYRLPSEAEWEYAARAGTTTRYSFGDAITPKDANYGGNVGKTTEVGAYPPNPWGLYDMHGNVWEWVEDVWHDSYNGAPVDGSAWTDREGTYSSRNRVVRGGSWSGDPWVLRSADRYWYLPDFRDLDLGFRVSRTLD